jgi:hypothetical protein
MKNTDIDLDILPSGQIRFCRCSKEVNDKLLEVLSGIGVNSAEDLIEFFEAGNSIEHILGNEPLCG